MQYVLLSTVQIAVTSTIGVFKIVVTHTSICICLTATRAAFNCANCSVTVTCTYNRCFANCNHRLGLLLQCVLLSTVQIAVIGTIYMYYSLANCGNTHTSGCVAAIYAIALQCVLLQCLSLQCVLLQCVLL